MKKNVFFILVLTAVLNVFFSCSNSSGGGGDYEDVYNLVDLNTGAGLDGIAVRVGYLMDNNPDYPVSSPNYTVLHNNNGEEYLFYKGVAGGNFYLIKGSAPVDNFSGVYICLMGSGSTNEDYYDYVGAAYGIEDPFASFKHRYFALYINKDKKEIKMFERPATCGNALGPASPTKTAAELEGCFTLTWN